MPRLAAWRLIHKSIEPSASIVTFSPTDHLTTIKRIGDLGISGGAVCDALIVKTAQESKVVGY